MEFASDLGKLQRLMASSSAGISRRQAILETLSINAGDQIIDVGCGGGHLLKHLANPDSFEHAIEYGRQFYRKYAAKIFVKFVSRAGSQEKNNPTPIVNSIFTILWKVFG